MGEVYLAEAACSALETGSIPSEKPPFFLFYQFSQALIMLSFFDSHVLLTGLFIFSARVVDVSLGTVRTIVTVQGRAVVAFFLAVVEITIWITAISTIIKQIDQSPVLIMFYSLGYACGNVTGILVERKLAFGKIILKVFAASNGQEIADKIRSMGQPVTIFKGYGMNGPVLELYIACGR